MARPALTARQKKLRISNAVYFCKLNNIEPTQNRLRKLVHMNNSTLVELDYKSIIDIYFKDNSLYNTLATPYTPICHTQSVILTPISNDKPVKWYPYVYNYDTYQMINGMLGYPLGTVNKYVHVDNKYGVNTVSGVMCMLATQLLKEFKLIHISTGFNNAVHLAGSVIKLLWATTLKDGRIYHNHSALRYLNAYDKNNVIVHKSMNSKCDGLFYRDERTGTINTGSYKFKLSRHGETFIRTLVQRYLDICLGDTKLDIRPSDMVVSKENILKLHTRDQIILLSRCAGMVSGSYHIVNDIKDTQDSRVYGLMTMLTSRGRNILGYKQYDIAAALQSIVFDVLDARAPYDAKKLFPAHFELIVDRKIFRQKISKETGKDISWIKVALTKVDNGGKVSDSVINKSNLLEKYINESRLFVDEFLMYIDNHLIDVAKKHTKQYDTRYEYIAKDIGTKYYEDGRKIFGLFFFVWTQIEREIRNKIKENFNSYCHDVHDAIATKEEVSLEQINLSLDYKYVKVEA